jgi:small GTP-binding protein
VSGVTTSGSPSTGTPGSDIVPRKIKILVLGDSGVGKSSIICRYISDSFNPSLVSTLGVDLKTKRVHVDDKLVQVQVWDTAGQTAFHRITTSYYRGSNAILLVYDISERATLENIEYWMKNIKQEASENVKVALIGNKTDLRAKEGYSQICVGPEEGRAVADKYKVIYAETSAMTSGAAVEEAFDKLIRQVLTADSPQIKGNRFTSSDGSKSPEIASLFSSRSKSVPALLDGKGAPTKASEGSPEAKSSEEDKKCIIS